MSDINIGLTLKTDVFLVTTCKTVTELIFAEGLTGRASSRISPRVRAMVSVSIVYSQRGLFLDMATGIR